jgi:hypothetical protein
MHVSLAAPPIRRRGYDYVFFFSYRYYHSYHGAKALPSRAILVPTAERDEAIGWHCRRACSAASAR